MVSKISIHCSSVCSKGNFFAISLVSGFFRNSTTSGEKCKFLPFFFYDGSTQAYGIFTKLSTGDCTYLATYEGVYFLLQGLVGNSTSNFDESKKFLPWLISLLQLFYDQNLSQRENIGLHLVFLILNLIFHLTKASKQIERKIQRAFPCEMHQKPKMILINPLKSTFISEITLDYLRCSL